MSRPTDRYPTEERRHPGAAASSRTASLDEALDTEIARLAPSRATVLVASASAEVRAEVARALHERSRRAAHPFVAVDCSALTPEEIEQALFGGPSYAAGAGGAVREAGRGTLHVASIEALPCAIQPRFLRFLDEGVVRVVASTGADLSLRIVEGRLRKDLGERLLLVRLVVATLR